MIRRWLCLGLVASAATEPLRGAGREVRPRLHASAGRHGGPFAPALLLASRSSAASNAAAAKDADGAPGGAPGGALGISHARLALYLVVWWSLNVIFNICNKQCLNSWPHPWALACLHLSIGSSCMLPLYCPLPRGRTPGKRWVAARTVPPLNTAALRCILPATLLLSVGHVCATLAPAYGTVAFSNIIKTCEPIFTATFSYFLYRRLFPPQAYVSLIMVVAGVALFSTYDLQYSTLSLIFGTVSNAAYALYSIRAKGLLRQLPELTPRNTYALLTISACFVLAPVALVMELSGAGRAKLASVAVTAPAAVKGWWLVGMLAFTGLLQYTSNEVAFECLSLIHPVTYAVSNTLKRSIVVAVALCFFGQRLPRTGAAGAAMAILGALSYSLTMFFYGRRKAEAAR